MIKEKVYIIKQAKSIVEVKPEDFISRKGQGSIECVNA